MEILKAIELLNGYPLKPKTAEDHDFLDALKLGKAALKRINTMRSYNINQAILPLPGEPRGHGKVVHLDDLRRIKS